MATHHSSGMNETTSTRSPVITRSRSAKWSAATAGWALVIMSLCAPSMLAGLPAEAAPQASGHEAAQSPVHDIAVSQIVMEQVLVPEGYEHARVVSVDAIAAQQQQVRALDAASSQDEAVGLEELTLARALISSPTAVVGVSFPRTEIDCELVFAYRTRSGDKWSQWADMEMSEPSEEALANGDLVQGSDPVTLVGVEEIEVSVKDGKGNSLPGAVLNVLEPELEAANLERVQREVHGEAAVEASASVLTHTEDGLTVGNTTPNSPSAPQNSQAAQSSNAAPSVAPDVTSESTAAERAEEKAIIEVPSAFGGAGAQGVSAPTSLRATGLSADGNTFTTNIPGLTITTRKGWGADEDLMEWEPDYVAFKGAVIHHTAGSNNYTKAQVPGLIRGIYRYHAVTLGWGDVGYHLLVDKFGGVWEGRAGGMTKPVEGGHAFGANASTFGVSVLGNFQNHKPSEEAVEAVSKAIAWKLKIHNITDLNRTFVVPGKQSGKSSVILPVISGHRHVGGTACPGEEFVKRIPDVRNRVKELLSGSGFQSLGSDRVSSAPQVQPRTAAWKSRSQIGQGWLLGDMYYAGAFTGSERTDALLVDRNGEMWVYPAVNNQYFVEARHKVGHGWGVMDNIMTGVDFDGDAIPDVLARVKSTGDLRLYPGNGTGHFKDSYRIGWGWGIFDRIFTLTVDSFETPVLYGVTHEGQLIAYMTDGYGSFTGKEVLGYGWDTMRDLNVVGDKTGDGKYDVIAIDASGFMWLYEGAGNGRLNGRHRIGQGWGNFSPVRTLDASGAIWTVDNGGRLWFYDFLGL